ncbi:MAG: hypothetical protein K2X81_23500, partial [Candidatus Obscuribacterales bacterium]|nr:hypothetical protein [Candidatus Obscuribacterales bacterium]
MSNSKSALKELASACRVNVSSKPQSLVAWLASCSQNTLHVVLLLIALNLVCYWQTMNGYFLADDFVHVAYLQKVFNGHPHLLLENFWSTWMQTEGTQFYRPLISLTLAWDFLVSGANATGFHVTNFVFQCLCTIGLFLFARSISDLKESDQSRVSVDGSLIAFIAAALFAVHPLHPEVVSWIIARVDSVCCCFYLFAFWLYIEAIKAQGKRRQMLRILSITLFAFSLMSKEMAVTLPPAVTLLLIIYPSSSGAGASEALPSRGFWRRILHAFKQSSWLWLTVIVYLVIRTLALGTLTGGYQGSIGEGLSTTVVQRIFSRESALRVVFPINQSQFLVNPGRACARTCMYVMAVIYSISAMFLLLRVLFFQLERKVLLLILFAAVWFVLVMVPAIPVWNLTESLQGSRFIYLGTAPLCLLLAAILVPYCGETCMDRDKLQSDSQTPPPGISNYVPCLTVNASAGLAAALIAVFAVVAFFNNTSWAHAGAELKCLRQQLDSTVGRLSNSQALVLLNLPHTYNGAH